MKKTKHDYIHKALQECYTNYLGLIEADAPQTIDPKLTKDFENNINKFLTSATANADELLQKYADDPQKLHDEYCKKLSTELGVQITPLKVTTKEEALDANLKVSLMATEQYMNNLKKKNPDIVNTPEYQRAASNIAMAKSAKEPSKVMQYLKLTGLVLAGLGAGILAYKLISYPSVWLNLKDYAGKVFGGLGTLKKVVLNKVRNLFGKGAYVKSQEEFESQISAAERKQQMEKLEQMDKLDQMRADALAQKTAAQQKEKLEQMEKLDQMRAEALAQKSTAPAKPREEFGKGTYTKSQEEFESQISAADKKQQMDKLDQVRADALKLQQDLKTIDKITANAGNSLGLFTFNPNIAEKLSDEAEKEIKNSKNDPDSKTNALQHLRILLGDLTISKQIDSKTAQELATKLANPNITPEEIEKVKIQLDAYLEKAKKNLGERVQKQLEQAAQQQKIEQDRIKQLMEIYTRTIYALLAQYADPSDETKVLKYRTVIEELSKAKTPSDLQNIIKKYFDPAEVEALPPVLKKSVFGEILDIGKKILGIGR